MTSMINGVPAWGFALVRPGDRPISNEEMLNSYVRFGVWMRCTQAYEQVKSCSRLKIRFHVSLRLLPFILRPELRSKTLLC